MAVLTGINFIRSFIRAYDGNRAYNIQHTEGWEGDTYFFQESFPSGGQPFVTARMEIEGSTLAIIDGVLTGTVETMRLSGRSGETLSNITGLDLDAENLAYLMLWSGRGSDGPQRELRDLLEGSITTHISEPLAHNIGNNAVRIQDQYVPHTIYLHERDEINIIRDGSTGDLNVIGTAAHEFMTFSSFRAGTVFHLSDTDMKAGGLTVNFQDIDAFWVYGAGLTVIGRDNANDALSAIRTFAGTQANRLEGQGGNDRLTGGVGLDHLLGGTGNDRLIGNGDRDTLDGGEGHDHVTGGSDADILFGRSGEDTLVGQEGDDTISAGSGDDSVSGGAGADRLSGAIGDDTVAGGEGADRIDGGDGHDQLTGNDGNDSVEGGAGDDRLLGDGGFDRLNGGEGQDRPVRRCTSGQSVGRWR